MFYIKERGFQDMNNIEYYHNFSEVPFDVHFDNGEHEGNPSIKVYDGEDVVFEYVSHYGKVSNRDLNDAIKKVLLWFFSPRIKDREGKILELFYEEGWRFIRKTRDDDDVQDVIKVLRTESSIEVSVEAFSDSFPSLDYQTYSIANLLGKRNV